MIAEHEIEPVAGLPGALPEGEHIIWQGSPVRARLARHAMHTRTVALYFGALIAFGLAMQSWMGAALTLAAGLTVLALLSAFAWASARSTLYTLTNRRVVIRAGVALPTCINVPLSLVESADLRMHDDGTGDIPLKLKRGEELGYVQLCRTHDHGTSTMPSRCCVQFRKRRVSRHCSHGQAVHGWRKSLPIRPRNWRWRRERAARSSSRPLPARRAIDGGGDDRLCYRRRRRGGRRR